MKLTRLRVSEEASQRLSLLKGRTGLTPNILCRIGFCLSLNDPSMPDPADYGKESEREIDRHTLTGARDSLFVAMLRERCHRDGLEEEQLAVQFKAHIDRGMLLLYKRVRDLNDLALLLLLPLPREVYERAGEIGGLGDWRLEIGRSGGLHNSPLTFPLAFDRKTP